MIKMPNRVKHLFPKRDRRNLFDRRNEIPRDKKMEFY